MRKQEFLQGAKDGMPICLGYFSVSMAFGLTAVLSGLPIWSAILISLTNLTSAGQFAGITTLTTGGTMLELAITTFIINIRYFLMSLSVSQKVDNKMTIFKRLLVSFGITDEIFAVSVSREKALSASYMAGLIITPIIGWTSGTAIGAIATSFMPKILSDAMGIALYGMFIAIVTGPAKKDRKVLISVVMAILTSLIFNFAPILKSISSGWSIIIITILVSSLCATLFPINIEEEKR